MTKFDRRNLLRYSAFGLAGAFSSKLFAAPRVLDLATPRFNAPLSSSEALIVVFLRGGADHIATKIPAGDSTYRGLRDNGDPATTVWVDPDDCDDLLGSSYAKLSPLWSKLLPADQANHVAWISRVGNPFGSRSHFEEMDKWEEAYVPTGIQAQPLGEGWVPRLLCVKPTNSIIPHANLAVRNQRAFKTSNPNTQGAHMRTIGTFNQEAANSAFALTLAPPEFTARMREAMDAHLLQNPTKSIEQLVDGTGEFMRQAEDYVSNNITVTHDPAAFPINPAEATAQGLPTLFGPGYLFMQQCEEALALALDPTNPACVVGVELGGWDTHNDQQSRRATLDPWIAHAVSSLYEKTINLVGKNVHIAVISEFGRTNAANGSNGTDHGIGNDMIVVGPGVNPGPTPGGVYNCHAPNDGGKGEVWQEMGFQQPAGSLYENAIEPVKDFRTIYAELLKRRFRLSDNDVDKVIPGWNMLKNSGDCYSLQNFIARAP